MTGPVSSNCAQAGLTHCSCTVARVSANCSSRSILLKACSANLRLKRANRADIALPACGSAREITPTTARCCPEALAGELISDDKADKADADDSKKTKVPSKEIKIDQVLGLG